MSKIIDISARMADQVRLIDHAGEMLQWLSREEAESLLERKIAEPLGTRRRIHVLRFCGAEPPLDRTRFRLRSPGAGTSHSRETYRNPRGVWTIDHIPASVHKIFTIVVDECLRDAA